MADEHNKKCNQVRVGTPKNTKADSYIKNLFMPFCALHPVLMSFFFFSWSKCPEHKAFLQSYRAICPLVLISCLHIQKIGAV